MVILISAEHVGYIFNIFKLVNLNNPFHTRGGGGGGVFYKAVRKVTNDFTNDLNMKSQMGCQSFS